MNRHPLKTTINETASRLVIWKYNPTVNWEKNTHYKINRSIMEKWMKPPLSREQYINKYMKQSTALAYD